MKRILVISIAALLIIATFFAVVFFATIPLGDPQLNVELYPDPPWHVRHGTTFDISVGVVNNAWLLAAAKDVRVKVVTPPGFNDSLTNLNECELNLGTLRGGEGLGWKLTIVISSNVLPGNYDMKIIALGDNVSEQSLKAQVIVELPYIP